MLSDDRMLNLAKMLDVASLRAHVHAANIANQNVPGYRAKAVSFETEFNKAMQQHGDEAARMVKPEVYEPQVTSVDNDGNDVDLDREVTAAAQNGVLYNTYVNLLRGKHTLLTTAIGGGA